MVHDPSKDDRTVFVSNLPFKLIETDLGTIFSKVSYFLTLGRMRRSTDVSSDNLLSSWLVRRSLVNSPGARFCWEIEGFRLRGIRGSSLCPICFGDGSIPGALRRRRQIGIWPTDVRLNL